jgi:serine/threonine protein kinase
MNAGFSFRSLGSGPDGGAFLGYEKVMPVVIHRLDAAFVGDPLRRRRLDRRVALHTQAETEGLRSLLSLRRVALDGDPAVVVVEHTERSLLDLPAWTDRASATAGLRVLRDAARMLGQLHVEGIVHGQFEEVGRAGIRLRADGTAALSALGLRTGLSDDRDQLDLLVSLLDERDSVAADAFAFGGLCLLCAVGPERARPLLLKLASSPSWSEREIGAVFEGVFQVAGMLRDDEPSWRPPLSEVATQLDSLLSLLEASEPRGGAPAQDAGGGGFEDQDAVTARAPMRVGRFRLDALLGSGAMGRVYRGTDLDSGSNVAVKLLARDGPITKRALQRFRKEARLLSEIKTPGVAQFLADGVEGDLLYLVTELVDGEPLSARLKKVGAFTEREGVDVVVDLLRALADVHGHGIVHRDLKPENMMVTSPLGSPPRMKLIDFGIARHLDEQGSLAMTRQGAVMGTPLYMAPEQVRGGVVDQRTDLYAVGTILFELLVGRPPFAGMSSSAVLASQLEQTPQAINELRPELSREVSRIVAQALEKLPSSRFADARTMLSALLPLSSEGARRAEPPPPSSGVQRWSSTWALQSSPEELWPFVSDTERVNQAIGLQAVEGGHTDGGGGTLLQGRSRQVGVSLAWDEHPYEWVYAKRLRVQRDYTSGPVRSMRSMVELFPGEGGRGTRLVHTIELEPRGLVGRALASVEVGVRTRRALDRVYRRIDGLLRGRDNVGGEAVDYFVPVTALPTEVEVRFAAAERAVVDDGVAPAVMEKIGAWLRSAPAQEVARIRPVALARRLGQDPEVVIDACLHATRRGLLVLLWDLLCPTCRAPAGMADTLKAVKEHGRCEACDLAWALDLSASIELVFRIHPSLREADTGTYCLSSPAHTPHVLAQLRLGAGVVSELELSLPEGSYRLTARRASWSHPFIVRAHAPPSTLRALLSAGPSEDASHVVKADVQRLLLDNDTGREQLVRIERTSPREDVLLASRVMSRPLFRKMFPAEILAPGTMVRAGDVTLFLAELRVPPSMSLQERYAKIRAIDDAVTAAGGSLVRLHGNHGVLATFAAPIDAVRAAMALPAHMGSETTATPQTQPAHAGGELAVAVHRGTAGAVALGDRLDYFGDVVGVVVDLANGAGPGELVVSDAVRADAVRAGVVFEAVVDVGATATDDMFVHRTRLLGKRFARGSLVP